MVVFDIDKAISEEARNIYINLKKINKLIPFADLLIAATAIQCKIPLVTLNRKHFEFIVGITLL